MLEMTSTGSDTVIGNARIVLADRVIERGWIAFAEGRVAEVGEGETPAGSEDAAGDLIMPGLIELHTDHLEAHYVPRPKVFWDPVAAVVSFDGQLATSGITTVLDSLRVWTEDGAEEVDGEAETLANAIGKARDSGMLRTNHFLHLRCEVPMPTVVDECAALIGAPHLVRGGSHAGNVAAADLAEAGVLDVLSSDYMPASLLMAALRLPDAVPGFGLPAAVRTVTKTPAEAVGLGDRGEILPGKPPAPIPVHVAARLPFVPPPCPSRNP